MIKIIAVADLHQGNNPSLPHNIRVVSQEELIRNLIQRNPDGILIAGDLQDYMWNSGLEANQVPEIKKQLRNDPIFNALNNASLPVFFIWGNTDIMDFEKGNTYQETPITDEMREWFCEEFSNLINCHEKVQYLKGLPILGYNDANKTTDDHSGKCWDEPVILESFQKLIRGLDEEKRRRSIFLSHTPPRGVLDFSSLGGKHIGSYYLRELIEEFNPILSIFGHVHYCGGYSELIQQTQCINVSSFGLVVSHDILFGQSAFELQISPNYEVSSTTMIVSHYWEGKQKKAFVEYRHCQVCGRHTPFARKQFKTCRVCLGARRIENRLGLQL
ncbi:MAG: metallophosphoesterase family protein [Candidatus Hodarchaeales archaeon]|jgi:Icc-related predicted phosphoesterase/ribosomal protein S14